MLGCLLAALILVCLPTPSTCGAKDIEHIVVLMLENRAFDHMCGFLKGLNPKIDGLDGDEYNLADPTNKDSRAVRVSNTSEYVVFDPEHTIDATARQTFGYWSPNDTYNTNADAPMNGFVYDANMVNAQNGDQIMRCFAPQHVPAISTLAQEFVIFDRWHASVPGPTHVNRLFVNSATSHGLTWNDPEKEAWGFPQKTIFESLDEKNVTWRVYMEQVTSVLMFNTMRRPTYAERFRFFEEFEFDARFGRLPTFSFLEPRYASESETVLANDQHPAHDVSQGEELIARVYNALRGSPKWKNTAFILTYDEHGGFYDHYPVPQRNIPNPDGITGEDPFFTFTRLGVRVPTIIASPWVPKGYVEHAAVGPTPYSHYEHSSIPATLKKLFDLPNFLTKRDAWAGTFEHIFEMLDSPRTDCVRTLPTPPKQKHNTHEEYLQPLNGLQKELVSFAASLGGITYDDVISKICTEEDAAAFMVEQMEKFLGRKRGERM